MGLLDDFQGAYNDQTIDPNYGIPRGMMLQNAMDNLGRTSAILLAAGQGGGPPGERAQILSKLADQNPNAGLIQMAQLRNNATEQQLRQQQLAGLRAGQAAVGQFANSMGLGGGSAPSSTAAPALSIGTAAGVGMPMGGGASGSFSAPVGAPMGGAPSANLDPTSTSPVQSDAAGTGGKISLSNGPTSTQQAQLIHAARTGNVSRWTELTGTPPETFQALAPSILMNPAEGMKQVGQMMKDYAEKRVVSKDQLSPTQFMTTDGLGNRKVESVANPDFDAMQKKVSGMQDAAEEANKNLNTSNLVLGYLQNAYGGPGGNLKLWAANNAAGLGTMLGIDPRNLQDTVTNTQTLKTLMEQAVIQRIKSMVSAGGEQNRLNQTEVKNAENWGGPNIDEKSVPSMIATVRKLSEFDQDTIGRYNDYRDRYLNVHQGLPSQRYAEAALRKIDIPSIGAVAPGQPYGTQPTGQTYPSAIGHDGAPVAPGGAPAAQGQGQGGPQVINTINYGGKLYNVVRMPDGTQRVATAGGR